MVAFELEHLEESDPEVTVVALVGELDLTNADSLVEELDAVAADRPLVLDLNRLLFIDSAALHVLFRIAQERGRDGLAIVIDAGAPVAATLAIVDFGRAAAMVPSREEASTALARRRSA